MGLLDNTHDLSLEDLSDEELLLRSQKSPKFFEVLLERYQEAFVRKARSVVRSEEDAKEIVQETFTKIYFNAHRFEVTETGSFKAWGYKILMNTAFTRYQRLKRTNQRTATLTPEYYETLPDTDMQQFEQQELTEYVSSIFERMPKPLARALQLHILEGRPQQEIADREGVSVGAIKTRVHRAKREFKRISGELLV